MSSLPVVSPASPSPVPPVLVASSPMLRRDFPGWLPPMLVKELRQGLRARGFVGALVLFQAVMFIATLGSLGAAVTSSSSRSANSALSAFFWTILIVQLLLVTPTRAVGGLQAEVDARTLDLLVLTRLNAWRIVLGKWFSLLAQAVLLLVAMLPYLIVRYFTDNADIGGDLGRCLIMLGASALLTAAGLWASGVARAFRVVIVILLAATVPTIAGGFGPTLFGRTVGAPNPFASFFHLPFDVFNATLLGAFFLVSAVRNIAPPAENHALFARCLPVLAFFPALFAAVYGAHALAVRQLYVAGAFLVLVSVFELASERLPMASHWAAWRRRGPFLRGIGRCALPGWQSALWHMLVAAALWIAIALIIIPAGTVASRTLAERVAWLAALAATALIFPVALRAFVRPGRIPPAVVYGVGLIGPVIVSWLALWLADSKWKFTALRSIMEVLPVSNFFFLATDGSQPPLTTLLQAFASALVVAVAAWHTRPYWTRVREFAASEPDAEKRT